MDILLYLLDLIGLAEGVRDYLDDESSDDDE